MTWVEGLATATTVLAICFLLLYIVGILRMPTGHRPEIVPMDRLGSPLPPRENPDYRDTEDSEDD